MAEAAFAAALAVRLGGWNRYGDAVERRPDLGTGPAPSAEDIVRATVLARRVDAAIIVAIAVTAAARWSVAARRGHRCLR